MSIFPALYAGADLTTGHDVFPPTGYVPPPVGASANVIMNGRFVHHVGDKTIIHIAPGVAFPPPHYDVIRTGFPTVLVNGTPVASQTLSVLTPDPPGIPAVSFMAGFSTVNVICGVGSLNTPARISGIKI